MLDSKETIKGLLSQSREGRCYSSGLPICKAVGHLSYLKELQHLDSRIPFSLVSQGEESFPNRGTLGKGHRGPEGKMRWAFKTPNGGKYCEEGTMGNKAPSPNMGPLKGRFSFFYQRNKDLLSSSSTIPKGGV